MSKPASIKERGEKDSQCHPLTVLPTSARPGVLEGTVCVFHWCAHSSGGFLDYRKAEWIRVQNTSWWTPPWCPRTAGASPVPTNGTGTREVTAVSLSQWDCSAWDAWAVCQQGAGAELWLCWSSDLSSCLPSKHENFCFSVLSRTPWPRVPYITLEGASRMLPFNVSFMNF